MFSQNFGNMRANDENIELRAEFNSPVSVIRKLWEMPEIDVQDEYRKKIERIIQQAIEIADTAVALLNLVRQNETSEHGHRSINR
jgi:hypothetical protein